MSPLKYNRTFWFHFWAKTAKHQWSQLLSIYHQGRIEGWAVNETLAVLERLFMLMPSFQLWSPCTYTWPSKVKGSRVLGRKFFIKRCHPLKGLWLWCWFSTTSSGAEPEIGGPLKRQKRNMFFQIVFQVKVSQGNKKEEKIYDIWGVYKGHSILYLGVIKQCKYLVILREFLDTGVFFGLVI